MAQLIEMVEGRRKSADMSYEDYAHAMGLKTSVLYKYVVKRGDRDMSIPNFRKMLQFYFTQGDTEMVNALISYATGGLYPLSLS